MEDYSSNEKVKPEKQNKKYYVYAFWSVCIYVCVMYVLSYLSSYFLFIKICYFILS